MTPRRFFTYLAPRAMEGICLCEDCRTAYSAEAQAAMHEVPESRVDERYECEICLYHRNEKTCLLCRKKRHEYSKWDLPQFPAKEGGTGSPWWGTDWGKFLGMVEIAVCRLCQIEFGYSPTFGIVSAGQVILRDRHGSAVFPKLDGLAPGGETFAVYLRRRGT